MILAPSTRWARVLAGWLLTGSALLSAQAANHPTEAEAELSPERLLERTKLLKTAEAALARLDVEVAHHALERAALIAHDGGTEIAIVHSHMQGGQYRRALAFGAHTAGAHLDEIGGAVLYAWLLHLGGQSVIAQRLLKETEARAPGDALVKQVQKQFNTGAPVASKALLALPTRLAPYGSSHGLPVNARVVGSGLLLASGKEALVPLALVSSASDADSFWLRNGLGQLSKAKITKRMPSADLALMALEHTLPKAEDWWVSSKDAFPGSIGYAVEYSVTSNSAPAWPILRTGFLGGVLMSDAGKSGSFTSAGERALGIDMPAGPRGGPVFDAGGRLIGLALKGKAGTPDRLIPASLLRRELGKKSLHEESTTATSLGALLADGVQGRVAIDKIYEVSLKATLQVIARP